MKLSILLHVIFAILLTFSFKTKKKIEHSYNIVNIKILPVKSYLPKKKNSVILSDNETSKHKMIVNKKIINQNKVRNTTLSTNNKKIIIDKKKNKPIVSQKKEALKKDKLATKKSNLKNIKKSRQSSDQKLTISEKDLIASQINDKWNRSFLVGLDNIENIEITVQIFLSYNGELSQHPKIISAICEFQDKLTYENLCKNSVLSVKRAIYRASPIQGLDIKNYNQWKEITLVFKPQ